MKLSYGLMITAHGSLNMPLDRRLTDSELARCHDQIQRTVHRVLTQRLRKISVEVTSVLLLNLEEETL